MESAQEIFVHQLMTHQGCVFGERRTCAPGRSVPFPELPHPRRRVLQKVAPTLSPSPKAALAIRNEVHRTG